jgi:hypothetical protein
MAKSLLKLGEAGARVGGQRRASMPQVVPPKIVTTRSAAGFGEHL